MSWYIVDALDVILLEKRLMVNTQLLGEERKETDLRAFCVLGVTNGLMRIQEIL